MSKKNSHLRFLLLTIVLSLFVSSCYDDTNVWTTIDGLESRISSLESTCNNLNANLTAFQTMMNAIQNNVYVNGVKETSDGYIISFSNGTIAYIRDGKDGVNGTNGKDGQDGRDGVDGADGYTPQIGIAKDSDGLWYWTLDGKWMTDVDGNKIRAIGLDGAQGDKGDTGEKGETGNAGVTPQLKIEGGYWYLSYDNGATWAEIGQATGNKGSQGEQGASGEKGDKGATGEKGDKGDRGDSFFASIDTTNTDYVIFTLSDGTTFQIPTWSAFETLKAQCDRMNTTIESMATILALVRDSVAKVDYVKGVDDIVEGEDTIGYVIHFFYSGDKYIYHGTNGQDGYTPEITVAKDSLGNWCWQLDGEWVLDSDGQKLQAAGQDGEDAITPQFSVEAGYWNVSYDGGQTWTQLCQATGDKGEKGDAFFDSVDYTTSDNYVIFTLSNGDTFKLPTWFAFGALLNRCDQLNKTIESMSDILANVRDSVATIDYVKGVDDIIEDGDTIGYVIHFFYSGDKYIYNGKDGADGLNGNTPQVSMAQDTDGRWYWQINGEWSLDNNDQKIPATGKDGTNGKDGVVPQFKIDAGYWNVSYDGGETWKQMGQAIGEKGEKGDAFFCSVDYTTSTDYVLFTLVDGTTLKLPTWSAFEALKQQCARMNETIESMGDILAIVRDSLSNADCVKSVEDIVEEGDTVGYIIHFLYSGDKYIYHGKNGAPGLDGYNPQISVKQDTDDEWYWMLDGEWMLDSEGNKVRASANDGKNGKDGEKPTLSIVDGKWYVQYGNSSKTYLGQATGNKGDKGDKGDAFFESVTESDDSEYVTFTLTNGDTFEIPLYKKLEINVDPYETIMDGGAKQTITYTVSGGGAKPEVSAVASGGWVVMVTRSGAKGVLTVKVPNPYVDSDVTLIASAFGQTTMTVLEFGTNPYVNLDLPSGNLWATTNLNAEESTSYGYYYAWGETTGHKRYSGYNFAFSNYKWCNGTYDSLTKYNNNASNGKVDYIRFLESADDAATVQLGEGWSIPKRADWTELRDYCTWTWKAIDGINGYVVASKKNVNSYIFLPAAGFMHDGSEYQIGSVGYYWTADLNTTQGYTSKAHCFQFNKDNGSSYSQEMRSYGITIRPVYKVTK